MSATDVFISSTCYDLGDLRAELQEYLHNHAFLVRVSEDYESEFEVNGQVDSIQSCLDNVVKADVLVCILDRRYGAPLPSTHASTPLSATHAEIAVACAMKKPIFTFIREQTYLEADQIRANAAYKPRWIDMKTRAELAMLVEGAKVLAAADSNNFVGQFKTSADLKPHVLKRLLHQFPGHVGAYARRPDRLVRMYFRFGGNNAGGMTTGTFVNAGNGPALEVVCGWLTGGQTTEHATQGGVQVGGEIHGPRGSDDKLAFPCPPSCNDLRFYCEYTNTSGDRFRVEAPARWTGGGYRREGREAFFIWAGLGGGWMPVV